MTSLVALLPSQPGRTRRHAIVPAAHAGPVGTTAGSVQPSLQLVQAVLGDAGAADGALGFTRDLSDRVGARLAGSSGADRAVDWALAAMRRAGLVNVRKEPLRVPRWIRGEESAEIVGPTSQKLHITTLGGSVGTRAPGAASDAAAAAIEGDVIESPSLDALPALGEKLRGRIVLLNREMARTRDFDGYRDAVAQRSRGAAHAGKYGALAVLVRSTGTGYHRLPHTGAMRYEDGGPRIPAAALATEDADLIHRLLQAGETVRVRLRLGARLDGEVESANVVGEVRGRELPQEVVLMGAHLDSWDLGTGALDDGAGCGIVLDTARRLALAAAQGRGPRRTVRAVLFMNEELGLSGARAYAKQHEGELSRHVAALEADSGSGAPFGYRVTGGEPARLLVGRWLAPLGSLVPTDISNVEEWGADLLPLQGAGVPVVGVAQDVSDYFEWHHTAGDTFDKIRPAELARAQAAFAALALAAADAPERLPPSPKPSRL